MYWVPYLSITFFVVTVLFSVYKGYVLGWKASLFYVLIFWLWTLVFVGVMYGIYDVLLWPLYEILYFDQIVTSQEFINTIVLSQYYETNVVLMSMGFLSPVVFLFTFLTYLGFKGKINKYLAIRTTKVSTYEKKVDKSPRTTRIKVSGAALLGTSSLFYASFMAGSLNTFTTPYNKSTFLTSTNDFLGKIYSLGLAQNTDVDDVANEFFQTQTDLEEVYAGVNSFLGFSTSGSGNQLPSVEDIENLLSLQTVNDLFAQSDEASEAVFASLINQQAVFIDILKLDPTTSSDSYKEVDGEQIQIGFGNEDETIFIEDIERFLEEYAYLTVNLPDTVKELLLETLESYIVPFEETFIAIEYANQQDIVEQWENELFARQDRLAKVIEEIANLESDNNQMYARLEDLTGYSRNEIEAWSDSVYPIPTKSGSILDAKHNELDIAQQEADAAQVDYDKTLEEYREAKSEYDYYENQIDSLLWKMSSLEEEIWSLEDEIASLERTISDWASEIVSLEEEIKNTTDEEEKSQKEGELTNLKSDLDWFEDRKASLENEQRNVEQQLSQTQKEYDDLVESDDWENAQKGFEVAAQELEDKASVLDAKESSLVQIQNELSNLEQEFYDTLTTIRSNEKRLADLYREASVLEGDSSASWQEKDDGSIAWVELQLEHAQTVEQELKIIYEDKEDVYQEIETRLLEAYKTWLNI